MLSFAGFKEVSHHVVSNRMNLETDCPHMT